VIFSLTIIATLIVMVLKRLIRDLILTMKEIGTALKLTIPNGIQVQVIIF
jgi:hypothetical protein